MIDHNEHINLETKRRYEFMMKSVADLGRKAIEMLKGEVSMMLKSDGTKLTIVDTALNQEFIQHVAASFPEDLVWGEEASNSETGNLEEANQKWMWTVDPIDSTSSLWRSYRERNFENCTARVLLAGFAPGEKSPRVSVVHSPFQQQTQTISACVDSVFYQSSSLPEPRWAWLDVTQPIYLTEVKTFEQNYWKDAEPDLSKLGKLMPQARKVRHPLFMASVALGDTELSAFPGPSNPHDVAPGAHIVHAAGGTVMSLGGKSYIEIDWRKQVPGVLCTASPELAEEFLEALP